MLEVQKYLAEHSLEDLKENFGINYHRHPSLPLVCLKYNHLFSPKYDAITRQCRGLVLEDSTWDVVARPFDRFYNYGEDPERSNLFNWEDFVCTEKCDGSLCIVYWYKGKWLVNTSGSFGLGLVGDSGLTWRQLFDQAANLDYSNLAKFDTYIFELCSPHNKVVQIHAKPKVYLLGIRSFVGYDYSWEYVKEEADCLGVQTPETYQLHSLEEIKSVLAELELAGSAREGVVIRDNANIRFKLKNKHYLRLHRLSNNGNIALDKYLVPVVLSGDFAEILLHFPDLNERITEIADKLSIEFTELLSVWASTLNIFSQKEFALAVLDQAKYPALLFNYRKQYGTMVNERLFREMWLASGDTIVDKWASR